MSETQISGQKFNLNAGESGKIPVQSAKVLHVMEVSHEAKVLAPETDYTVKDGRVCLRKAAEVMVVYEYQGGAS